MAAETVVPHVQLAGIAKLMLAVRSRSIGCVLEFSVE